MTEDPEEEIAIEVDDPLSKAISRFNIDGSVPKIAYHPAPARRWNAPWQFMSDFDIPVVLFCDDLDNNQGAPDRDGQGSYYPDLLKIEHVAIDGQVIKDENCSAHYDPSLIYDNRLIYRTCSANDGIHDFPFIDIFYTDYRFGILTPNADRIPRCEEYDTRDEEYPTHVNKDEVVREIVEYCYHIKDGGLLIVENWIMDDLERRIPNIRFEVDGRRASNRFGRISIEYLGEYRLKTGEFPERDKVEVFKIHSEVKFEKPDNFLAKCFVDINWD
tara:strand:- start:61 stop:879 length:819 start_codon:yes stop_codon:yes gene_type:complete